MIEIYAAATMSNWSSVRRGRPGPRQVDRFRLIAGLLMAVGVVGLRLPTSTTGMVENVEDPRQGLQPSHRHGSPRDQHQPSNSGNIGEGDIMEVPVGSMGRATSPKRCF